MERNESNLSKCSSVRSEIRKPGEEIVIIDFGSQVCHLIAKTIRSFGVHSLIVPHTIGIEDLKAMEPKGIIFSGGPGSIYESNSPTLSFRLVELGGKVPILGICYGLHLIVYELGGEVVSSRKNTTEKTSDDTDVGGEYGLEELFIDLAQHPLMQGIRPEHVQTSPETDIQLCHSNENKTEMIGTRNVRVVMSHGDSIAKLPEGFSILAHTVHCPFAAIANHTYNLYGVQFHPEVSHTEFGRKFLINFVLNVVGARQGSWSLSEEMEEILVELRRVVTAPILMAVSGGIDSTVTACLLAEAVPDFLYCIMIDNGFLRAGETEEVRKLFVEHLKLQHFEIVDAHEEFLESLVGIRDPEEKRRRIGHKFIQVLERYSKQLQEALFTFDRENILNSSSSSFSTTSTNGISSCSTNGSNRMFRFLGQGTIYPDRVESARIGVTSGAMHVIKTHHNVGGLPERMQLQLIEPLRDFYKDEVRWIGRHRLHLPEPFLERQPFPGPGLAIRILGEVNAIRLATLRKADRILMESLRLEEPHLWKKLWQAFVVLLPVRTVGVMGDRRTYEEVCALRIVCSEDAMTAIVPEVPFHTLQLIARKIVNQAPGINRVVLDLTGKPPATIEWE